MLKVVASCAAVLTVRSANDIAPVEHRYSIVYFRGLQGVEGSNGLDKWETLTKMSIAVRVEKDEVAAVQ